MPTRSIFLHWLTLMLYLAPDISGPSTDCSCLELISPDTWISVDGWVKPDISGAALSNRPLPNRYEFACNEWVNAVESVSLETQSTESGRKDFIAVATTIYRGEDLAVKGAVSAQCATLLASRRLRLVRCRFTFLRSWKWYQNIRRPKGSLNYA